MDTDQVIRALVLIGWLLYMTPRAFSIGDKGQRTIYLALGMTLTIGFVIAFAAEIEWLLKR